MSASSKKKLRAAEDAAKLTERQLAEQQEAKKLKLYTTAFVVVLALLIVVALVIGVSQTIANSGIRERNTVALTLESTDPSKPSITISNAEMAYYYVDFVQNYCNENSYYLAYLLDVTKPLDQQPYVGSPDTTWADFFLTSAQTNACNVYAMCADAAANGFVLPESEKAGLEAQIANVEFYAMIYGHPSADSYLKSMYGRSANLETYREYLERNALASAYYNAYADTLEYDDADLRAAEAENYFTYSSFTYHSYQVRTNHFLEGGTQGEDGTVTYSDEENAAAQKAMEETVNALVNPETPYATVEEMDAAISALPINADSQTPVTSTLFENQLFSAITEEVAQWLTGAEHQKGDYAAVPIYAESSEGEGTVITGYYVIYFISRNDNTQPLANVRHILVGFEGGTTDASGATVYSDEEIADAQEAAEDLLDLWKAGDATEDSFGVLASEHSTDPGSAANGGLYMNVYPGQMVEPFDTWCFNSRQVGDTGIVKTNYGFHVMYYSGDSETTYRDFMITNDLTTQDVAAWEQSVLSGYSLVPGSSKYLPLDMVLSK